MNNNMLPPSASGFMRSTETVTERLTDIPVDLRKLWNPDECPADLLPYLAWALSVDRWDKNWSEQTKRQVIKASWLVHRQKGTISALRRVVEPFGFLLRVIEWWQSGEEPGTFKLEIGAGCYIGDTLTVYPYFPETISVGGADYTGAAVHLIDTVEIASGD